MILRRLVGHMKQQHWTAVFIDFVIVVLGVFIGLQVDNWNAARADKLRSDALVATISADLHDFSRVTARFAKIALGGLADFEASRARGERPAPFFLRIRGSANPPQSVWEVAMQSNLTNLVPPDLIFDLGFFYSEQQGIGVKFARYQNFVEREILPRLGNPSAFYDNDRQLKQEFVQNMERLKEWARDNSVLVDSSNCLQERFQAPTKPGVSCRPDYGNYAVLDPRP